MVSVWIPTTERWLLILLLIIAGSASSQDSNQSSGGEASTPLDPLEWAASLAKDKNAATFVQKQQVPTSLVVATVGEQSALEFMTLDRKVFAPRSFLDLASSRDVVWSHTLNEPILDLRSKSKKGASEALTIVSLMAESGADTLLLVEPAALRTRLYYRQAGIPRLLVTQPLAKDVSLKTDGILDVLQVLGYDAFVVAIQDRYLLAATPGLSKVKGLSGSIVCRSANQAVIAPQRRRRCGALTLLRGRYPYSTFQIISLRPDVDIGFGTKLIFESPDMRTQNPQQSDN